MKATLELIGNRGMTRNLYLLFCYFLGFFSCFFIFNFLLMDDLGRKDQALFTILKVLEVNNIPLTRNQVEKTLVKIYPEEDLVKKENLILVQKMEFVFREGLIYEINTM